MEISRGAMVIHRLCNKLKECEQEKEALKKQVEELKAQLQRAEIHGDSQEKVEQLTAEPEGREIQTEIPPLLEKPGRLQDKLRELNDLLERERAINRWARDARLELSKELENAKEQLGHQKSLKEMFINREKETRRELEKLKKLSDPKTLNNLQEFHDEIKNKKKKELQRELEELKVVYKTNQEKLSEDLEAERDRNVALQQELGGLKVSHEINRRCEAELKDEREKSDGLQKQLEEAIRSRAEKTSEKLEIMRQLSALLQQLKELQEPEDESPSMVFYECRTGGEDLML